MIDSMIEPLTDEVQLALLALQKTKKQLCAADSKESMTPAPNE